MLSDVFEGATNLLADIYLEDADKTYMCTITNRQQALEFEGRKDRPNQFRVVFRTSEGVNLCTQRYRKIDEVVEQLNKK